MKLSNEVKRNIEDEYQAFKERLYAGKSLKERQQFDQFFTPASVCIEMIEKFDCDSLAGKKILDPTCGSGCLLAACLIAGADGDKIFGNDLDEKMVIVCKDRLKRICEKYHIEGFRDWQIHVGDASDPICLTNFSPKYKPPQDPSADEWDSFFRNYSESSEP